MSLRLGLLSLLVAAPLMFAGQQASATAYSFSSSGSTLGCTPASTCTGNGTSEIGWGGRNGSTMSNVTVNGSGNTSPTASVKIGQLSWDNEETEGSASTITASYNLVLKFTLPAPGATGNETISLNITNTPNSALCSIFDFCFSVDNDMTGVGDGSSVTIDGLILSDFSFTASNDSTFKNGIWSNPENNTGTLSIFAKISDAPAPVPEPGSLAVLGTALAGLGLIRLRKRAAQKA